jgi:hypothetical protein
MHSTSGEVERGNDEIIIEAIIEDIGFRGDIYK